MSGLRGIAKNLSALFSSHVINALQQVALTPLFLTVYGAAGYGQWLALSASVSYLGTLDFGVQTFVNQDLTVRYHQGDMDEFHLTQSTALRLMLGVILSVAVLALVAFTLPIQAWLKLDGSKGGFVTSPHTAQMAIYLLALQVLCTIPFGFLSGNFMVVRRAHVGAYWNNAKSLAIILGGFIAVELHKSFAVIAAAQLLAVVLTGLGVLIHLRLSAPQIFPKIRYWDGALARKILGPSGHFALIYSCTFLLFQVPIMILNVLVGPAEVAAFSLMRIIFSMSRQVLAALTQALGPEITAQFAKKDWPRLSNLYRLSERLIFSAIPFFSIGILAASPLLLRVWAHKPDLFQVVPYCICACISTVMAAKEHKLQFQFSTNTHRELSRVMFTSYVALILVSLVLVRHFGVTGFLSAWLAVELIQLAYTVHLNHKLFAQFIKLSSNLLVRMLLLSLAGVAASEFLLSRWIARGTLGAQILLPIALASALLLIAFPLFGLKDVVDQMKQRWFRRSVAIAAANDMGTPPPEVMP